MELALLVAGLFALSVWFCPPRGGWRSWWERRPWRNNWERVEAEVREKEIASEFTSWDVEFERQTSRRLQGSQRCGSCGAVMLTGERADWWPKNVRYECSPEVCIWRTVLGSES